MPASSEWPGKGSYGAQTFQRAESWSALVQGQASRRNRTTRIGIPETRAALGALYKNWHKEQRAALEGQVEIPIKTAKMKSHRSLP